MTKMKVMRNEGDVKVNIRRIIEKHTSDELWYFMPPSNGYGRAGIPDFLGCYNGYLFAIEAKFGNNTLSKHQERECGLIKGANAAMFIINEKNVEAFADEFDAWIAKCS